MTVTRVHLDGLHIKLRSGWVEALVRQLEQAIGDPRLAEQAARAISEQVAKQPGRLNKRSRANGSTR